MVNLSRSLAGITTEIKKPIGEKGIILPAVGVTTGLIAGGFISETMARALGYIGYKKAAVKTGIKAALAALFLGASLGIPGSSFLLYPAAIGTLGTIPLDWIDAKWSGGVTGLAEKAAVVIRTWSMGVEKVQTEIAQLEKLSHNTIIETEGEVHFPFENTHTKAEVERRLQGLGLVKGIPTAEGLRAESPLNFSLSRN